MGKAPIPTIVGGGIALVPGAIGEYLFVTSIIPPEASTSPRVRIVAGAPATIIMETAAARGDTVIGPGTTNTGAVSSILIGKTVTSTTATLSTLIGSNIGQPGTGGNNVIIGHMAVGIFPAAGFTGSDNVHVGQVGSLGGAFRNSSVSVGHNVTVAGSSVVVIGRVASATGNNSVVIGDSASSAAGDNVVIGTSSGAAGASSTCIGRAVTGTGTTTNLIALGNSIAVPNLSTIIAIGNSASVTGLAAGDILVGHNVVGAFSTRVVWGGANQHTTGTVVPAWTIRHKNALGTDIAAGSVTYIAPLATGNAVGGSFVFQTGPAGASGAAQQAATTRLTISPNGVSTFGTPTAAAENVILEGFGGAGQASIRLNNLTDGAGALAGTLGNSPVLGDPTFWIPVNIAGAVKHIPAW